MMGWGSPRLGLPEGEDQPKEPLPLRVGTWYLDQGLGNLKGWKNFYSCPGNRMRSC